MPIYALLEGLVLGGASLMIPAYFGAPMAVVGQAILGTAATFFVMLILYRSGVITVNQKFVGVVIAATIGIGVVYQMCIRDRCVRPAGRPTSSNAPH